MFLAPRAKDTSGTCVTVDNEKVECINSLKLLGVVLDNKLNFNEHVKLTCSKANFKIGVLTRMRKLVPEKTKLRLLNLLSLLARTIVQL